MIAAAWTLGAWPEVLWQPDRDLSPHLVHLATHVAPRITRNWPHMGQTAWVAKTEDGTAGLSWDWVEIAVGIVAIADPMSITTNLRLLGPDGEVLTAHAMAPHLNRLVHALSWQPEVLRAMAQLKTRTDQPAQQPFRWLQTAPTVGAFALAD